MAERNVLTYDGSVSFRLQRYVWRSKPTTSPLTGRSARAVVGQDENGAFRAAKRIGRGDGKRFEIDFAREAFATKDAAIEASRGMTRDFLSGDAQVYANKVTGKKPGEEIVKVEMDDGWSMAIHAEGRVTPAERKVMALLDRMGKGEQRQPKVRAKEREGRSH